MKGFVELWDVQETNDDLAETIETSQRLVNSGDFDEASVGHLHRVQTGVQLADVRLASADPALLPKNAAEQIRKQSTRIRALLEKVEQDGSFTCRAAA